MELPEDDQVLDEFDGVKGKTSNNGGEKESKVNQK
jgi:hypothetical protein